MGGVSIAILVSYVDIIYYYLHTRIIKKTLFTADNDNSVLNNSIIKS